jgi:hypothetical protein
MHSEDKGSTPGLSAERNQLTRVNTFPNAEFTIPPSDTLSPCRSVPTHTADARASEKLKENLRKSTATGDEEANAVTSHDNDEVTYPEGGLAAWLVVLG